MSKRLLICRPGGAPAPQSSKFSQRSSSGVSSTSSAWNEVRVSARLRGPMSANVGNAWHSTYASAIMIGSTPFFPASSYALARLLISRTMSGVWELNGQFLVGLVGVTLLQLVVLELLASRLLEKTSHQHTVESGSQEPPP